MPYFVVELEETRKYRMQYRVKAKDTAEAARLAIEDETGPEVETLSEEIKDVTGCELVHAVEEAHDAACAEEKQLA